MVTLKFKIKVDLGRGIAFQCYSILAFQCYSILIPPLFFAQYIPDTVLSFKTILTQILHSKT